MNFADLQELLRLELVRRIESGALTGTRLAQQTGFQQAHISNFLNRKRALSLEGLDRVLTAQKLTIEQILPLDLAASGALPADPSESVPLVSPSVAIEQPEIPPSAVIESITLSTPRLLENRTRSSPARKHWHRFVAVRVDAQQAAAMAPLLPEGSIVILDRHYTSLSPYRPHQPTTYAVRFGSSLLLRLVDFDENHLILRPYARSFPVTLLPVPPPSSPTELIIGRICFVLSDL